MPMSYEHHERHQKSPLGHSGRRPDCRESNRARHACLAYYDPAYVRMAQQSLPLWRELEDDAGEPLLDTTGSIDHGDPDDVNAVAGISCTGHSSRTTGCGVAIQGKPHSGTWHPAVPIDSPIVTKSSCPAKISLKPSARHI